MTNAETSTLVFKDGTGSYFLVPRETLEQGRVPAAHTAEIERLIAEQDDVQGHVVPVIFLLACFNIGAWTGLGIAMSGPEVSVPRGSSRR